jgi:phosphate transport system permease protein
LEQENSSNLQQNEEKKNNFRVENRGSHRRSLFYDKTARIVIFSGGIATIIAVLGILAFVFVESYPLWLSADGGVEDKFASQKIIHPRLPVLIGIDEYQEIAYAVTDSAGIDFIDLNKKLLIKSFAIEEMPNTKIISASKTLQDNHIGIGNSNGTIALLKINFNVSFAANDNRIIQPELEVKKIVQVDSLNRPVTDIVYRVNKDGNPSVVTLIDNKELVFYSYEKSRSLISNDEEKEFFFSLTDKIDGKITAIELDDFCEKLMVGTADGKLYYFSVRDKDNPFLVKAVEATPSPDIAITALRFIIGDQSLIVGDAAGHISSWMRVLDDEGDYGWKLVQPHTFKTQQSAVLSIAASARNKTFITGDDQGNVHIKHLTSERTLLELKGANEEIKDIVFSPKGDGALVLYKDGSIVQFFIDSPHPEITLKTVFGKVWYEGYKEPAYVWQSTGGTDDFEPKLSLIPLILGTLKGTFYALIFAIPIALFGALYTALFSHPKIKNIIKPTVEVMAALPSVVIGFLAGLWLAPLLERILPGVMLIFIISPVMMIVGVFIWKNFKNWTGIPLKTGFELLIIIPLLILGIQVSLWLGPSFELFAFAGDYRAWLKEFFNEQYDQRNSIVVGFAMGFAVIPIIFTICEDALSSVPQHLSSASLALGATRWQTAVRVVLPTASPGIFSAIMIGFGRAIGETMIVLMATGNTPILDFSPFNGMRTLSANIAVEIPEAPYQGTLYRVLFLTATILFIMTFIVNTVAEIVRQRLRKKYMDI